MKTGLVLEGGAMQGMYTAGVLDQMMVNNIEFDGIIGVSAGALFGVNYLSKQPGRVVRYNKKFNKDRNYMGIKPLIKTGNIVSTEYAYERVPRHLDPFDNETFKKSKVPFYAVMTNIETGLAEYIQITNPFEQMDYIRASGSMPFLSRPVEINGNLYLDGAMADSIPYWKMLELGYDRLVVVLTKDASYVRKPFYKAPCKVIYGRKYPQLARLLLVRHKMYQSQLDGLAKLEKEGIATIIRPSEPMYIDKMERDPAKIEMLYRLGLKDGEEFVRNWAGDK